MKFEFDSEKSAKTKADRGLDFNEVQAVWNDENAVHIPTYSGVALDGSEEIRYLVIGKIGSKLWSVVYADLGHAVRIISARRSRNTEEKIYND